MVMLARKKWRRGECVYILLTINEKERAKE